MTVDPSVIPGLLFLLAELVALTGVGYVIVLVALRETDRRVALAQGLVVGPAIWGVVVNLIMYVLPGIAGAIAGWVFVLTLAAVLVWRSAKPLRPQLRTATGFALAALAIFWVALASRQTVGISDAPIHIGLAASIRAGLFPPELPWSPGMPASYHYGANLVRGLLAPPSGPDMAFVEELLGAYAWVSLFLVVVTTLIRRASGPIALIAAPLLLAVGSLPKVVLPAGIPAAGLRSSLMDIFWPWSELLHDAPVGALQNVHKPAFTLSYALALVVLTHAASPRRRSWLSVMMLAGLVGFLGLLSISLVPIVLVVWAGLEATFLVRTRRAGTTRWSDVARSASGPVFAAFLLLAGGFSAYILGGSAASSFLFGINDWSRGWRLFGTLGQLPGGVGMLSIGPLVAAGVAALLAWRDRLVQALLAVTGILLLTWLLLTYEPRPWDIVRIERHAHIFALFALLIALSTRLADLRHAPSRHAVVAAIVVLIVWPSTVHPIRNLAHALGNGVQVANAQPMHEDSGELSSRRFVLEPLPSNRIAAYVRKNTDVDARIFSPHPHQLTHATGRSNASGFVGLVHFLEAEGPEYRDVLGYLEPAATRRLGIDYVHASEAWVDSLPDEAVQRLGNRQFFELLIRDESESLYRVLPAFLRLDAPPAPGSYESLRQAVPASTMVLLPRIFEASGSRHTARTWIRTARALSHTRLLGFINPTRLHLLTPWRAEPVGNQVPDLIITPAQFSPWMFPAASRQPIWWNDETAVYALDGAVDPIRPPPPWAEPLPFGIRVSEVSEADGRIAFTATFDDRAPDQWTGQDWVIVEIQSPPRNLPKQVFGNGSAAIAMWFDSYLNPGQNVSSFHYEFAVREPVLAVRGGGGVMEPLQRSEGELDPGNYLLAVRLRHEYKPNQWRDAAIIPVLRITVSETGNVSYEVHEDVLGS